MNLFTFQLILFSFFLNTCFANSVNWGHLLSGTSQTLNEKETTIGLHLLAYGITNDLSFGVSPWAYLSYDFNNVFFRYRFYNHGSVSQALDFIYLDSKDEVTDSVFDQTSFWGKYNLAYKHSSKLYSYLSLGLQYYSKDKSPHSLRGDPKGKYRTLGIKGDDEFIYQDKLDDYKAYKRDPKTTSLSYLLELNLFSNYSLNLEYGFLGLNYDYPYEHIGVSLFYANNNHFVAYGWSRSSRTTPYVGRENVYHPEIKYQYSF